MLDIAASGVEERAVEVVFDVVEGGLGGGQGYFAVADAAASLFLLALVLEYLFGQLGYPSLERSSLYIPFCFFPSQCFLDLVTLLLYFL